MPGKRQRNDGEQEDHDELPEPENSRFVWGPNDLQIYRNGELLTPRDQAEVPICMCGCEQPTRGGEFLPGHDARLKSRLLSAARGGDVQARAKLLERGWATEESIDSVPAKASEAEREERRRARLQAKAERLRLELASVEAQLAESRAEGSARGRTSCRPRRGRCECQSEQQFTSASAH